MSRTTWWVYVWIDRETTDVLDARLVLLAGCAAAGAPGRLIDMAGWWLQQHRAGTHELRCAGSPEAFKEAVRVVNRENEQGRLQQSSKE